MTLQECRILLVDDEAALLQMVGNLLKKEGYHHVDTAANCKEAVQLTKENEYQLVLLDVMLPDGSYGYENSLMVHIRHLREKLEENPSKPEHLLTVRGLGYKLK